MYISQKLGMLTYDPATDGISKIRNAMALELVIGKHMVKRRHGKETDLNMCSCATSYKQVIGKEVTLYCKAFLSYGNTFSWTLGPNTVSYDQVHKFQLTERNTGTCFCYVSHKDGGVSSCSCDVTILKRQSCDTKRILAELRTTKATIRKDCV